MIANCSSGIEPYFALYYDKHVLDGEILHETNQFFFEQLHRNGLGTKRIMELMSNRGTIKDIDEIPEEMRNIFVTAHDIEPDQQVRMQSIFQEHVDNGVSKTINLPESSSVEDVRRIYLLAHELHCKGITVYREGTKPGQVLTSAGRGVGCMTCGQLV
jgi:ribonucleoside-diphosphate reductase alpha chain